MNFNSQELPKSEKFNRYLGDIQNKISPIMLSGLLDVGKIHMTYATKFYTNRPILIITYNEMQARKIINDLKYFEQDILYFPKKEIMSYDYLAQSKDILYARIDTLNRIYDNEASIIVTTIEAISQQIISKESLYKNILELKTGKTYNLDQLKSKLLCLGYERYELIENRGQFSVRGGIIDISVSDNTGIRIEFWGDEIDSIRYFNIQTQRSTEMINQVYIYPAHEYLLDNSLDTVISNILKNKYTAQEKEKVNEDIELIKSGNYTSKIDKYFNSFYTKKETVISYLSKNYLIFIDEVSKIKNRIDNIEKDYIQIITELIEKEKIVPDSIRNIQNYYTFINNISKHQTVYLEKHDMGFIDKENMHAKRNGYSFSYREVNFFRSSLDICFQEIQEAVKIKKRVIILGGSKENSKRLSQILLDNKIDNIYREDLNKENYIKNINCEKPVITIGALSSGFECYDFNVLVISVENFLEQERNKVRSSNIFKQGEKVIFADLKIGDYVVHKIHGIGQFIGVNTITADNVTKDYIKIKYRDDDILYIPTNALDNIRKYIGSKESAPRLNRLGTKEWQKTKAKVKSNLQEVAKNLISLYATRQKIKGYSFSKDTTWQAQFEDKFEYVETDDQLRCIQEMKNDMEQSKPMDRLLCGDVGYGKTEVAIRGAFKACMDQKQVAYLVPTTILANQQYEHFKNRMEDFPIKIELLNRFKTKKEQDIIIKKLKLGEIDIIIGTHRLLSKDVQFKDLGLLIIDEEHRFGVKDKERIKELKTNIDVLTMTATPIPRTLHMSIIGIRDMSVIYDPPQNRRPVQTYVLEYDEEVVKEAITKEIERHGQIFYLYNKVETIIKKVEEISKLVPEAKIGYAHGKMTGRELEEIMLNFVDKKIDVLVCTTILESGIDIPNANTIIVENAQNLGLAQLYQIRGRVGRSNIQAYAYITYKRDKLLAESADKRLKAIKEFTEFGSGFKIAMRDLEIRGAGSLLR